MKKTLMNIAHVNSDGTTRKLSKAEVKKFQTLLDKPIEPENIALDFLTDLLSDRETRKKYLLAQIINDGKKDAFIFRMMASRGLDRSRTSKQEETFKDLLAKKKIDILKHWKKLQEQCDEAGLDLSQSTVRKLQIKYREK